MRGGRWLLGAGEFLVGLAVRRWPAAAREERRREWAAELPVILGDPEVKSAAVRAARMLSFAADTLRGAALRPGPGPARHRGAHRGAATWGKDARELGVLAAALTAIAALPAGLAFMIYQSIVGVNLAYYVVAFLLALAGLAAFLLLRLPAWAVRYWFTAGAVAETAARLVRTLAGDLGWGHPLLFTLINDCGWAVLAACIGVAGAIMIRSARRAGRPDPGPLR